MKLSCETGSRLQSLFRLCRTLVSFLALLFVILPWSLSHAASPNLDLKLGNLFPVGHPFSNPFKPRLFPRHDEGPASARASEEMPLPPESSILTIRMPVSANLQTGYVHSFQPDRHGGRFAVDGLGLVQLTRRLTLLGEVHTELESLRFVDPNWLQSRSDWSGGLGIRGLPYRDLMLGANLFLDTSRLDGTWHRSGGLGLEMAAGFSDLPLDTFDVAVNLHKGGGIDTEAGISFPLHEYVDLRVRLGKYRFYDGEYLLGWKAGTELRACDDLVKLTYQFEQDRDHSASHTVGVALSANLNLEDLFSGSWPFEWPKRLSDRKKRFANQMNHRVKRNWHQPASFVRYASNSQSMWNTPGTIRWDGDDDFSPTAVVFKTFFCGKSDSDKGSSGKEDRTKYTSVSEALCSFVVGTVTTVTTGVMELGYRSLFGPFETDPRPRP